MEVFPEFTPTDYFLSGDGTASTEKPAANAPASTTYKHDPSDPIPTLGGNNLPSSIGGSIPCGPLDQSSIDGRDDMVVFDVATAEKELVMTGPINAELYVSSDMIDTDFMVRVSDVYNDEAGTVRLLQDNAVRMRWRDATTDPSTQEPQFLTPGEVYKINVNLWNTSYVLAPGHNLRFVVQSTNFPRFSVNNNNGLLLADPAYPGPPTVAQNTIYHSTDYPSKIVLPIVKKVALPKVHLIKEVQKKYPHITDEIIKKVGTWIEKKLSKKF
jgi:putative CocE/NonD family hydrolase